MIYSPLEQFNILSIFDFSLINLSCFQIIYVKILFLIWSLFYTWPLELLMNLSTLPIFNIITQLIFGFYNVLSLILTSIISLYINLCYNVFNTLSLIQPLYIIDTFYNIYYTLLCFIWYKLYADLSYLYSIDNLYILSLFSNHSNDITASNALFQQFNFSLISGQLGYTFSNLYFLISDIFLNIETFFYSWTFGLLFSICLKDVSYLILSLNTSTIWLTLGFVVLVFLFSSITVKMTVVSQNRWQTLLEIFYDVILGVVNENAGSKARKYFPLIFTTFMLILICNILGMIPYSFTVTSHLIVTFCTALAIFSGMNIYGILIHRKHFLSLFFPPGAPVALAPLLVMIETISYVFRVLSLSIRLFANLMSGHTLLKILATFSWGVVSFFGIFLIPIAIIFIVTGLEMAIAFLQAYIFSVLLCIYLHDAFNLH